MKKIMILALLCVIAQGALAQTSLKYYYECSWDEENKQVVRTELTASGKIDDISTAKYASGGGLKGEDYDYFVATKSCTIRNGLTASGTCNLILLDGVTVTVIGNGIEVLHGSSLNIYAQSYEGNNIGKLISRPEKNGDAAIGGKGSNRVGGIVINGGIVEAYSGEDAAGIGGGRNGNGGTVVIYDGNVTAQGGEAGAGIGGGYQGNGDHLIVYGGTVKATGGIFAAGIGSGRNYDGSASVYKGGTVEIFGGKVTANGGEYGAGIGGGQDACGADVIVAGGHVETDGGMDAAGIGSGESFSNDINGGSLTVTGGYVYADGTSWGAGIGGGEDAKGANVEITGGTVVAWAGSDAGEKNGSAIGSEDGDGRRGSLHIGDKMMVHAGQNPGDANGHLFSTGERVPACFFRPYCRVEVCNHEGHTYTINGTDANDTHTLRCPHCLDRTEEKHTFEGGKCSVCGAAGSAFDVKVYLPNTSGSGYGSPQTFNIAANKEFMLPSPPDENEPTGLAFAGWAKSETEEPTTQILNDYKPLDGETLLAANEKITITNTTYLVARYNSVSISLINDQDNSTILLNNNKKKASSVTLTGRTLYKGGTWNTLCLPFDVTIADSPLAGDGVVAKTLDRSSFENGTLTINFKDAPETITAGTPFLIKWDKSENNIIDPEFTNVTIKNNLADTKTDCIVFIGTFSPDGIYEEGAKTKLYLGGDNKLYYPTNEDFKVNACRGYFQLRGDIVAGTPISADQMAASAFYLNLDEDATGISSIQQSTSITQTRDWYTLDGRRLNRKPTTKGIYIHDGKKFVIK